MQEFRFGNNKGTVKIDYRHPKLSIREEMECCLEGILILLLFSYFFYRSVFAFFILSPLIIFYRKEKQKKLFKKKRDKLEEEFRETLLLIQSNLHSGYSIENAFVESYHYIVEIFGDSSNMAKELMWIKKGLSNGNTLEQLLLDLAKRCPQSALEEFADIYNIICKTGGDWNEIIGKIVNSISQRIEIQEEINIIIHGKKTESRVMCIIPFFILFYMDTTSRGYFNVMYHNPIGIGIMTLCMIAYIFAFLMAEKITEVV